MSPRLLDFDGALVGDHAENCKRVKERLVELNPGYNVFIYWGATDNAIPQNLTDWRAGTFTSRSGRFAWGYTYNYFVFQEGEVIWSGKDVPDKLCMTRDNYDFFDGREYHFQKLSRKKVDWGNWMGQLRKSMGTRQTQLYLSSLSLPSTHNSHALASNIFSSWAWTSYIPGIFGDIHATAASVATCQSASVKEQLEMGVRCIDLRVGEGLKLRHGKVELTGHLDDILKVMDEFLAAHPSETIMFQAKWDNEPYSDENRSRTATEVAKLLQNYPRALIRSSQPKLSECEGKMVLFNDNGKGAWAPEGVPFAVNVEGEGDLNRQWDGVRKTVEQMQSCSNIQDGRFCDLWCCAESLHNWSEPLDVITGKKEVTRPQTFADRVNPQLFSWLTTHRCGAEDAQRRSGRLGRVNLDFAERKLVHEIVLWNFDNGFLGL